MEDDDHAWCMKGAPEGGIQAKGAGRKQIVNVYRKMQEEEVSLTLKERHLQGPEAGVRDGPRTEKWLTTDLKHSKAFNNRAVEQGVKQEVVEFQIRKNGFKKNISNDAVPQREARQNPGKNVYNNERGVRNYGIKGPDNRAAFNKDVVKVKKVDPFQKGPARWIAKNKVAAGCATIAVVVETTHIYLAVKEDGGKFGPLTTLAVSECGGGLAGGYVGAEIGAVIGSVFPGLGTIIGGFIGGAIGGIAGSLGGGAFASLFLDVPYTPSPHQWETLVPFRGDEKYFNPEQLFVLCDNIFEVKVDFFEVEKDFYAYEDIFTTTENNVLELDNDHSWTPDDIFQPDDIF